MHVKLIS